MRCVTYSGQWNWQRSQYFIGKSSLLPYMNLRCQGPNVLVHVPGGLDHERNKYMPTRFDSSMMRIPFCLGDALAHDGAQVHIPIGSAASACGLAS